MQMFDTVERDMVLMTLVIFLPSLFALALMFFPKGSEEWMRWFALLGTALTLVISLVIFIDFKQDVIDPNISTDRAPDERLLETRGLRVAEGLAPGRSEGRSRSASDWVARYPWIQRFGIDYYLGIDGIS